MGNMAFVMGVLGTILGGILLLQNLSDMSQVGPASAVMIITLFYGLIGKALCMATASKHWKKTKLII